MIPISDDPGPRRLTPIVTFMLLAINIAVFVYQLTLGRGVETLWRSAGVVPLEYARGIDIPPAAPLDVYYTTLLTSMFLHGGFLHIASNMLFLWIYGDNVEDRLGHLRFLLFYLLCGFGATGFHLFFNWGSPIPSIGASGAIAGVLAGYLVLFPSASIRTLLFIGPFITVTRVPAIILIGFWFVTQLFSGVASIAEVAEQTSGIAFWAHVGGFVVGLPLVLLFRRPAHTQRYALR
ncbi:MAG: rhomboid family intramembrane serine protease [Chloroflexota bacterium]|nr:rhomboid family intramembrane serine protease [Chloroflexota bacterium]